MAGTTELIYAAIGIGGAVLLWKTGILDQIGQTLAHHKGFAGGHGGGGHAGGHQGGHEVGHEVGHRDVGHGGIHEGPEIIGYPCPPYPYPGSELCLRPRMRLLVA